jgi:hypothetical protein
MISDLSALVFYLQELKLCLGVHIERFFFVDASFF